MLAANASWESAGGQKDHEDLCSNSKSIAASACHISGSGQKSFKNNGLANLQPGAQLTVIAWLWARTVKSPNPAFSHVDVPLASTFILSSKAGQRKLCAAGGGRRRLPL
jgi:hypothetical protein